jgi:hypothetical protein
MDIVYKGKGTLQHLREVYYRAVQIPLENVNILWNDLDLLEISIDKIGVSKYMYYLNSLI